MTYIYTNMQISIHVYVNRSCRCIDCFWRLESIEHIQRICIHICIFLYTYGHNIETYIYTGHVDALTAFGGLKALNIFRESEAMELKCSRILVDSSPSGYFIIRLFCYVFFYLCGYFSLLMPYWLKSMF
jgi:hypothetical protein